MNTIYQQLVERNERETIPYKSIYNDYMELLQSYHSLEKKYYHRSSATTSSNSHQFYQPNEHLQQQHETSSISNMINSKDNAVVDPRITSDVSSTTNTEETIQLKKIQEQSDIIKSLQQQIEENESRIQRYQQQIQEQEIHTTLLQEQNDQLKTTLRSIHNNYDTIQVEKKKLYDTYVKEKDELLQRIEHLQLSSTSKVSKDATVTTRQPQQQSPVIPPTSTSTSTAAAAAAAAAAATAATVSSSTSTPSSFSSSALSWFTGSSTTNKKEVIYPNSNTTISSSTSAPIIQPPSPGGTRSTVVVTAVGVPAAPTTTILMESLVSNDNIPFLVCTVPKTIIHQTLTIIMNQSHQQSSTIEGSCARYDRYTSTSSSSITIVTSSTDSTIKVWQLPVHPQQQQDTTSSTSLLLRSSLRVGSSSTGGYTMNTASTNCYCDLLHQHYMVGICQNDKSCRIWDIRRKNQERMIHQLVGHTNKITCVRLFYHHINGKAMVITGSTDKTIRIWDISRTTYQQVMTLHYHSTSTCVDIGTIRSSSNSAIVETIAITGHMDGGIRLWNIQSGKLISNASLLHEGGISSVQFKPSDNTQVLSCSVDSSMKIVDIRTMKTIHTFHHIQGSSNSSTTSTTNHHHWLCCCTFSPDGRYVASASSMNGTILIWDTIDRSIKAQLMNNNVSSNIATTSTGIISLDWWYQPVPTTSATTSVGLEEQLQQQQYQQQLASLDRKGILTIWS